MLKLSNPSALGTVPCCHVACPQGRFCSRQGRCRCPQSGWPYQVAILAETRLDPIPADLKTRLGKGWEGAREGDDAASHASNPLLLLPACLITAGHRGTDRHGAAAATSSTHGWVPGHPQAPWVWIRPAAEDLTCRRSSLKTSVFSALQDKKEHKVLAKGLAHVAETGLHAVVLGTAEHAFPSGCSR